MASGSFRVTSLKNVVNDLTYMTFLQSPYEKYTDVYYDPRYLESTSLIDKGTINVAIYTHPHGTVVYPFVVREIENIFNYKGDGKTIRDITTPYEYGGPIVQENKPGSEQKICTDFAREFSGFCKSQNIVSEFVRFHPLMNIHSKWTNVYKIRKSQENIVIDLNKNKDDIFAGYSINHRRNIKVSMKRGIITTKAPNSAKNFTKFQQLYYETMKKVASSRFYYFSQEYFKKLSTIGDDLVTLYFSKDVNGTIASGALFLHNSVYANYHLGATNQNLSNLRPNNHLFHTAVQDMKAQGVSYLHLGGAADNQEGLLRFKQGFSKDSRPYFIGTKIHDPEMYDKLTMEWGGQNPNKNSEESDYFPLYRA